MSFCNQRLAHIESIKDGHVVASLQIDYEVNEKDFEKALTVDLHVSGEHGNHEAHFCMRRDVYYNLPQKINKWLRSIDLSAQGLTAPLCEGGVLHASLALEMLSEIRSELGSEDKVDLDRFLSDHY